jgi:hypothetical protein
LTKSIINTEEKESEQKSPIKEYYKHRGKRRRALPKSVINTGENKEEPCQRFL